MRVTVLFALAGLASYTTPAAAESLDITVNVPRLPVAEYHRPYVAIWLEKPGMPSIRTLAVWYDHDMRNNEGRKWLSDLRTWWRKGGRSAQIDGVTGATRAPGPQRLTVPATSLKGLPAGDYQLVVEAAREVGGRETVRLPITLGGKRSATARAEGKSELGTVIATVKP